MIKLMRYNNFTLDPLSRCDCSPPFSGENAISARNDLNPRNGTYPFGALGHRLVKIVNFNQINLSCCWTVAGVTEELIWRWHLINYHKHCNLLHNLAQPGILFLPSYGQTKVKLCWFYWKSEKIIHFHRFCWHSTCWPPRHLAVWANNSNMAKLRNIRRIGLKYLSFLFSIFTYYHQDIAN